MVGRIHTMRGLYERHARSVYAYCERVADPPQAIEAMADTFAAVAAEEAAGEPESREERLAVLAATRRAAVGRTWSSQRPTAQCGPLADSVVGRLAGTLGTDARQTLDQHLSDCPGCARLMKRFRSAEAAFEAPPRAPLPVAIASQLRDALALRGLDGIEPGPGPNPATIATGPSPVAGAPVDPAGAAPRRLAGSRRGSPPEGRARWGPGARIAGGVVVVLPAVVILVGTSLLGGGTEEPAGGMRPEVGLATPAAGAQEGSAGSEGASGPDAAPVRPGVIVRSAVLTPAGTPSGQARQRARLSVRVQVRNRTDRSISLPEAVLIIGEDEVRPDPNAADAAGPLLRPLAPRARVVGELRFETQGAVTRQLAQQTEARLRYSGHTSRLSIDIGPPGRPVGAQGALGRKGE